MTQDERNIMADMFYFLRDHCDPPPPGMKESVSFWEKASNDIAELVGRKWNNHPLARNVGVVLYDYIGDKSKAKG